MDRRLTPLLFLLLALGPALVRGGDPPGVNWRPYAEAMPKAVSQNRPLVVYFCQDGCRPCEMLDQNGFSRPEIAAYINGKFVAARVNIDREPDLKAKHKVPSAPVVWFLTPAGEGIDFFMGYVPPERLSLILHYVGDGAYKTMSFDAYERQQRKK